MEAYINIKDLLTDSSSMAIIGVKDASVFPLENLTLAIQEHFDSTAEVKYENIPSSADMEVLLQGGEVCVTFDLKHEDEESYYKASVELTRTWLY